MATSALAATGFTHCRIGLITSPPKYWPVYNPAECACLEAELIVALEFAKAAAESADNLRAFLPPPE
jgi:hypothetical protein